MDDKRKDYTNPKDPKRNHPQQLQTYNVPTDNGENANGTNKCGCSIFVKQPWIVHRETIRIPQRNENIRRASIDWSIHPEGEQNET